MEYLFFAELINWLGDGSARISGYSVEINGEYYYLDTDSDIKKLFEMFKKERL